MGRLFNEGDLRIRARTARSGPSAPPAPDTQDPTTISPTGPTIPSRPWERQDAPDDEPWWSWRLPSPRTPNRRRDWDDDDQAA